jgi:hypothetical protein
MPGASDYIRPSAEFLRHQPTLDTLTPEKGRLSAWEYARNKGIDFVHELKLQRPSFRYWLCTKGVPENAPGFNKDFVVGNVIVEELYEGRWCRSGTYSPKETKTGQGEDYFRFLGEELVRLCEDYKKNPTVELGKRMQALKSELRSVIDCLGVEEPAVASLCPSTPERSGPFSDSLC